MTPNDIKSRPTRATLLRVVEQLQRLVGHASATNGNDRDPNGFEKAQQALNEAFELCIKARSFDPPPRRLE